jgi:hypothetical protein
MPARGGPHRRWSKVPCYVAPPWQQLEENIAAERMLCLPQPDRSYMREDIALLSGRGIVCWDGLYDRRTGKAERFEHGSCEEWACFHDAKHPVFIMRKIIADDGVPRVISRGLPTEPNGCGSIRR